MTSQVEIQKNRVRLAREALELREKGLTFAEIGRQLGICRERARSRVGFGKRSSCDEFADLTERAKNCLRNICERKFLSKDLTVDRIMALEEPDLKRQPALGASTFWEIINLRDRVRAGIR